MNSSFSETQQFTQPWLWIIIIITLLATGLGFIRFLRSENIKNINPAVYLLFLLPIVMLIPLRAMKLETRIDKTGIYYRFFPFRMRESKIEWDSVDKAYVRKYSPGREYGGWGIRGTSRNEALNVKGSEGLQLILKNGNRLLIGTQRPDAVQSLLLQYSKEHVIDSQILKTVI